MNKFWIKSSCMPLFHSDTIDDESSVIIFQKCGQKKNPKNTGNPFCFWGTKGVIFVCLLPVYVKKSV
jgi:hypothetical protein